MLKRINKEFLGILVLVFAILVVYSSFAYANSLRVAVMDFDGDGHSSYHDQAANTLTNVLLDLRRFDIISRSEVDSILDEQGFQQSGLVDPSTAQESGNILGVDKIFVGNVDRLTTSYSDGNYNGEAQISIRLIDVSSGQILNSYYLEGSSSEDGRTDARAEAINSAFDRNFKRQLRQRYAITSFVERISGDRIDLFGGQEMGINSGDRYYALRDDNGFERKIGKIEIEQTSTDRARAKVLWQSEPIEVDDTVREVAHRRREMTGVFATLVNNGEDDLAYQVGASILTERAFTGATSFDLFFAQAEQRNYFGVEGNISYEFPLVAGRVYATPIAGAGILSDIDKDSADFYGRLGAGIKFYPMYDSGLRVRLGLDGRLGTEENFNGLGFNFMTTLFRF